MSVTLTVAAGELSFWRTLSSTTGSGGLTFEIDGASQFQWSGATPWQQSFFRVSAGQHTFSWIYAKGAGATAGNDCACLDDVEFAPGTTLTVAGTPQGNQFSFDASGAAVVVTLNGEPHSFTAGEFTNYVFHGGGGDTAALTGSAGGNSALLYGNGSGQLDNSAAGYMVAVDGMASIQVNGHAGDTATFYDSPGNDNFYAYADYNNSGKPLAGMYGGYGGGYSNSASGFGTNIGISTNGGSDTASFYDSPGNDNFYAYADYNNSGKPLAGMYGGYGGGYSNSASGFGTNVAYATNGGSDTAIFYDLAGNAAFYACANYKSGKSLAGMYGSCGGYSNLASGFGTNIGISTDGNSDTATFYGSPGNDSFYAYADYKNSGKSLAGMYGGYGGGYVNSASGFGTNVAYETNGGKNTATFYDSPGNDNFYACADYNNSGKPLAGMYGGYGGGYSNSASGFGTNVAYASNGGSDTATFYDSPGNDAFFACANYKGGGKSLAGMYGSYGGGYSNSASGFGTNVGISTNGGNDTADLYAASGNDALYTDLAIAQLYGNNYSEEASGFDVVNAIGSQFGVNTKGRGPLKYDLNYVGKWVGGS